MSLRWRTWPCATRLVFSNAHWEIDGHTLTTGTEVCGQTFPGDSVPRHLLRDRDGIYGKYFCHRVKNVGITEVLTAARSPWQNPYVERLIGSIRRECLDQVIVLNERHLCRVVRSYFQYYHRSRCHLSLEGDAPEPRSVQGPELGKVIELPEVGGLQHRYVRQAA